MQGTRPSRNRSLAASSITDLFPVTRRQTRASTRRVTRHKENRQPSPPNGAIAMSAARTRQKREKGLPRTVTKPKAKPLAVVASAATSVAKNERATSSRGSKKRRRSPSPPPPPVCIDITSPTPLATMTPRAVSPPGSTRKAKQVKKASAGPGASNSSKAPCSKPLRLQEPLLAPSHNSSSRSYIDISEEKENQSRIHNVESPARKKGGHTAKRRKKAQQESGAGASQNAMVDEGEETEESRAVTAPQNETEDEEGGQLTLHFLERVYETLSTSYVPDELKGRETEYRKIWHFFESALQKRQPNSMILVGSPGVGKTAVMTALLKKLKAWEKKEKLPVSHIVSVNAMRFSQPSAIYPHLWSEVSPRTKKRLSPFEASQKLEARFLCEKRSANQRMTIVIVDEIDALLETSQTVLYKLFSWPKQLNSTLIVLGISNEIELTNLFLPRLAQRGCSPDLLVFDPYTQPQLQAILEHRIAMCAQSGDDNDNCLIERNAMTLITKKVASVSGDIRKGLEICRKAFRALAEKASERGESPNGDHDTIRVRFLDVMHVIRTFFASPFVEIVRGLPTHQQTALCVAVLMDRESKGRDITIGKFLEFFSDLRHRWDFASPAFGEFWDMIQALSSHGLVSVSQPKIHRGGKKPSKSSSSAMKSSVALHYRGDSHFSDSSSSSKQSSAKAAAAAAGQQSQKPAAAPEATPSWMHRSAQRRRRPGHAVGAARGMSLLSLGGVVGRRKRAATGGADSSSRNCVLALVVSSDDVACAVQASGNKMLERLLKTKVLVQDKYFGAYT